MPRRKKVYEPTPKALMFWEKYTNPNSPTYSNARQSALAAGYSDAHAKSRIHVQTIPKMKQYIAENYHGGKTIPDKIVEQAEKREKMLEKAEQNIEKDLSIGDHEGEKLRGIRNKTTLFVAETLGKDNYSRRSEVVNTGYEALNEVVQAKLSSVLIEENPPEYRILEENEATESPESDEKDATWYMYRVIRDGQS